MVSTLQTYIFGFCCDTSYSSLVLLIWERRAGAWLLVLVDPDTDQARQTRQKHRCSHKSKAWTQRVKLKNVAKLGKSANTTGGMRARKDAPWVQVV